MKSFFVLALFSFMSILVKSQGVTYTFNSGTEGWTLISSLTGTVSGGCYNLTINGADPYMVSPSSLGLSAANNIMFKIKVKNSTSDNSFQLFWITNSDGTWNQQKSYSFGVAPNDNQIREYSFIVASKSTWSGTIKQIRLDPGNTITSGSVQIDEIAIVPYDFSLDNGIIKIKQDLTRGGAINYISASSNTTNIVNIYDEGRYIQQSYYAGNSVNRQPEGQNPNWSPWAWNPIQVGDCYLNRAEILAFYKSSDSMYVKCIPKQWDMNNMAAQAYMEQWTVLQGNVIKVKNKLTCFRTDNIYGEGYNLDQELPAVYPISSLKNLYTYIGTAPFTNEPVQNHPVVNLSSGFWGVYENGNAPSEKWMAFVNDNLWGIGVYTPIAGKFLAGMFGSAGGGATSSSTCYISPTKKVSLYKNSVFEYEYFLVVGNLTDIRNTIYNLHGVNQPVAGTISAPFSALCPGESTTLSISGNYNGTIQWQSSLNNSTWTNISGANAPSYSSGAITANTYYRAKFSSGGSDVYSNVVQLTLNSLPAAAGFISGNATVCQGASSEVYTVPVINNAASYQWTLPSGANGTSTTNSISVNFDTSAESGNIAVKGINSCGEGEQSVFAVTVNSIPDAAGNITGESEICAGENSVIYSVPSILNAASYQWTLPSGAIGTSTTNSISINFDTSAESGNITVKGINSCGEGAQSIFAVTVNSIPETPFVTYDGTNLFSDLPNGNQWYNQNGLISGATGSSYTPTETGNYYSIVTLSGCSSDTSTNIYVVVTDRNSIVFEDVLQIYPNPVSDELFVNTGNKKMSFDMEILNSLGQTVFKQHFFGKIIIPTKHFSNGIYTLRLLNNLKVVTFQFIKK